MSDPDELRALAEKATPGPWAIAWHSIEHKWVVTHAEHDFIIVSGQDIRVNGGSSPKEWLLPESGEYFDDAQYIAAANPAAILALLDRVTRWEAIEAAARDLLIAPGAGYQERERASHALAAALEGGTDA